MYQQHMLLKLRKPTYKYTLNKYHDHWLSSFKHLKVPISIKISVTIWQIVYIYMTAISPKAGSAIPVHHKVLTLCMLGNFS